MHSPTDMPTDSPTYLATDMPTELTDVKIDEVDSKTLGIHVSDLPTDLANEQAEADPKLMETPTNMTKADVLLRYITAPKNEAKPKEVLVHVTQKLADGQAHGNEFLHEFVFSQFFFRESGATVTCEACELFYDFADVCMDGGQGHVLQCVLGSSPWRVVFENVGARDAERERYWSTGS